MASNESDDSKSEEMVPLAYAPLTATNENDANDTIDEQFEIDPGNLTILQLKVVLLIIWLR